MSIFKNGNVITLDNNKIAQAFCVRDGYFKAVGSNEEIGSLKEPDEAVIDLKEKTVVPGFNDSHMHFLNYAVFKSRIDLTNIESIDEMIKKTKEYVQKNNIPKGHWIISRGWNHNHFIEKRLPNKYDLDKISTEHPIFFSRVCGHIGVANSAALKFSGINKETRNPEGGVIDKEDSGPTGILKENAMNLILKNIPDMKKQDIKKALKDAFNDALSCGLTTIHSEDLGTAGNLKTLIEAYKDLEEAGELPLRFVLQLNLANKSAIEEAKSLGIKSRWGTQMLSVGILKLYQDGSLGGRTAAMEEPYLDSKTNGVIIYTQEELDSLVLQGYEAGFQIGIHAIGDRAMSMILNTYEKLKSKYSNEEIRPIIIHCQFTNKELMDKFQKLGVIANVQPSFVMTDWPIVEKAVGLKRAADSYNWKSMLDSNIKVSFSSDAPIESFNPLYGIFSAVTRRDLYKKPIEGWYSDQCLTVEEALKCFTVGSAFMNFEEDIKGSISKEKLADFVVLSEDILTVQKDKIKDIEILETYVSGKMVYKNKKE